MTRKCSLPRAVFVVSALLQAGCSEEASRPLWVRTQVTPFMERGSDDHSPHDSAGRSVFVSDRDGCPWIFVVSETDADPLPADDRICGAEDPAMSPMGDRVAFVAPVEPDGRKQLFISFLAGGEPIAVGPSGDDAADPAWLPDGSALVYARRSERRTDYDIVSIEIGGDPSILFGGEGNQLSPAVHPDGQWIAYRSGEGSLFLGSAEKAPKILVKGTFEDPAWSPDGRFLAATSGGKLHLFSVEKEVAVSVDGDPPRGRHPSWVDENTVRVERTVPAVPAKVWLDDDRIHAIGAGSGKSVISPSPSSQSTLLLARDSTGIVVMDMRADADVFRQVTEGGDGDSDPGWSPDGSAFVFTSTRGGNTDLYLRQFPGLEERRLTRDPASDRMARFSNSGNDLVFVSERSGDTRIYILNVDSGDIEMIDTPLGGSPSHPSLSPNGRWVYYSTDRDDRRMVEAYNRRTGEQRPLTEGDIGDDVEAACSPDGIYVAFARWIDGDSDVYIVPALGGKARPVFKNPLLRAGHPDWIRGGAQVLFQEGGGSDLWDVAFVGLR